MAAYPKRADVLAATTLDLAAINAGLDQLVAAAEVFEHPLTTSSTAYSEGYNPARVAILKQHLETLRSQFEALYTETPHRPASSRPPVIAESDDE